MRTIRRRSIPTCSLYKCSGPACSSSSLCQMAIVSESSARRVAAAKTRDVPCARPCGGLATLSSLRSLRECSGGSKSRSGQGSRTQPWRAVFAIFIFTNNTPFFGLFDEFASVCCFITRLADTLRGRQPKMDVNGMGANKGSLRALSYIFSVNTCELYKISRKLKSAVL